MRLVTLYAMIDAWGLEPKDDRLLYLRGTSQLADGEYKGYYPKFLGFGKSDKINSIGVVKKGELISWKRFNKYGDIQEYWDK